LQEPATLGFSYGLSVAKILATSATISVRSVSVISNGSRRQMSTSFRRRSFKANCCSPLSLFPYSRKAKARPLSAFSKAKWTFLFTWDLSFLGPSSRTEIPERVT